VLQQEKCDATEQGSRRFGAGNTKNTTFILTRPKSQLWTVG